MQFTSKLSVVLVIFTAGYTAAYQVTTPSQVTQWCAGGENPLSWQMVDTDPSHFTVTLVNQDRSALPENNLMLASNVDGSTGSITLKPPQGGWPHGSGFQVNLVASTSQINTIYAQSPQFSLVESSNCASNSQVTQTSTGTPTSPASTNSGVYASPTALVLNPSTTLTHAASSGATSSSHLHSEQVGLLVVAVVLSVLIF